jgi:hypothetical protein
MNVRWIVDAVCSPPFHALYTLFMTAASRIQSVTEGVYCSTQGRIPSWPGS